jgi:phage-related protein
VTSKGSRTRIKWEGDSNQEIRRWPADVRQDLGAELQRLDNYEDPLNSKAMGKSLSGVRELRTDDKDFWYRLFYWPHEGWIYVLHCFRKKTNQTSLADVKLAKQRMNAARSRNDAPPSEDEGNA